MRTIHGQVLASTGTDRHGHSIPIDKLRLLYEQIPDPWILHDSHGPAKPPAGRSYNKQFVQLDSGNWAICSDVDVYDEAAFARCGGFSIAFTVSRFSIAPDRDPEIEITLNPHLTPLEDFCDLARRSTAGLQIDVCELFQKSLDVPAIIFLSFASGAVANGFFGALGTDLYGLLKSRIKALGDRIKRDHKTELQCNMGFTVQRGGGRTQILVAVRYADLDVLAERGISAESILDHVREVAGNKELQKVVVRVTRAEPVLFIEYYTDAMNITHKPGSADPPTEA